ncbi:MAG: FAD-binding protein [Pseudomonadota bacterium]|nr:FAD-binding protein [Pseudomonadota bacterium]
MKTLVIAEHDNTELKAVTLNAVAAATRLGDVIDLLVAGWGCDEVVEAAKRVAGVRKVLVSDDELYEHALAENLALLTAEVAQHYSHVLAPATTFGKNFMPRAAALLDLAQISDIVAIESEDTFVRPIYAGNVLATVRSGDPVKIITVRASAFDAAPAKGGSAAVEAIAPAQGAAGTVFVDRELAISERPDLTDARVVVAGGRGLGSAENFRQLEALADKLGAAVGASRAAVDAGFTSNDHQVGQSGKIVAPELYIAVGISGAIQHLAGMLESRVIVAINNDPEAPIFKVADYGLVADLFDVLPEVTAALNKEEP